MTIGLDQLARELLPQKTVLFFGSGSSIPSGCPSVQDLVTKFETQFGLDRDKFNLAEAVFLAEAKSGRRAVIKCLRQAIGKPSPTGGLTNIPLYGWKSIFTTNYDELIEKAFEKNGSDLSVYTTNFDFSQESNPISQKLFKVHGTVGQDISDGSKSRLVLSESDYDRTQDYRELIYDRLKADLAGSHLVIIGYSLSDPEIKKVVDRALKINADAGAEICRISLMMYNTDVDRAAILEARGVRVSFGGIDEFFAALAKYSEIEVKHAIEMALLEGSPLLRAVSIDVHHALTAIPADFNAMFNGNPASYADVAAGYTFERTVAERIRQNFDKGTAQVCVLLGAAGVGKSTAARQVAAGLEQEGWRCFEHKVDFELHIDEWIKIAEGLVRSGQNALLVIDEAHSQISAINRLVEKLNSDSNKKLRILIVSSRASWLPRVKSPVINREGKEFVLTRLNGNEIDRLLSLVETNETIRPLVEASFSGYSSQERKRRLSERCEADMFVCLKNIFSTESFDAIILREFASLGEDDREIYKLVAAMQNSGIRVHRQLVVRQLGISAAAIPAVLINLSDIVTEYDISPKEGVYGWRVRHSVIAGIIVKYKFFDPEKTVELFDSVIDSISPTYELERITIKELCNVSTGIPSIASKRTQNRLLRKIISKAPGERVPRHRLIRNLIDLSDFNVAETEIRLFNSDIGRDGPAARYQVDLLVARARETPGILLEDKKAMLKTAESLAVSFVDRYSQNARVYNSYCDVGLEWFKITKDRSIFDDAIDRFKKAEAKLGDSEMSRLIGHQQRRMHEGDLFDVTA